MDEVIDKMGVNDRSSKEATRVVVDPNQAPRCTPKRRTDRVTAGSRPALLSAVQQQNHTMVEQLLDHGVPTDSIGERNPLAVAIVNNDFTSVRLLLLFGADPNAKDKDSFTPLFSATQASFYEAAELLLKYGADPNISAGPYDESAYARALDSGQTPLVELYLRYGANSDGIMGNGNTPFIQAITKTVPIKLMDLMLMYNADPNCKNGRGESALFRAINAERLDIVTALIDHGANPNLPGPKHMLWPSVHQPRTLELLLQRGADLQRAPGVLELATSINSLEAVSILLKYGADPNAKKDGIFTPLCTAIRDDHGGLVDLLIAAGADPNLQASEFPAFKCITHHRAHLLPRILAAGADPSSPRGILETAVAHNEKDALVLLLERKVDPNARSAAGHTPLTTAIRTGRLEMLDILLSHNADPGVRGQEWPISMAVKNPEILSKLLNHIQANKIIKGALEQAVVANQIESVKLLLAAGVSVEDKNGGVFSPLTTSIRENRKEIFRFLIDEAGADPNAPGEHLPIIKAIRRHRENDLSYIEHLIDKGADINLMYRGWNAVLQAVDNGDVKILKLLAERGSPDLNAQDENGMSVLEIMEDRGLREEEHILLGGRSPSPQMKEANGQLRELVRA
jgi:ankyrin repeat protein